MAHNETKKIDVKDLTLSGFLATQLPKTLFIGGAICLLLTLMYLVKDPHHAYFSYLTSFTFFMTLSLGALFFVMLQYITRAGWSVVVRRIPEHMMLNIGLMAIFFIPIIFGIHHLYHWSHLDAVAHDHLLQIKSPYLNQTFFIIRAALFFGSWIFLAKKFFNKSLSQDKKTDSKATLYLQKTATYGMFIFALTQTFAFIDWVMSLTPHWYSTIFGVYFFGGSMVCFFAITSIIFIILRKAGYLKDIVTKDHYHDLGKLLYGFNIFWSYIAFSQYFLIWYSNIPEETVWFTEHFMGNWNSVAALLAIGHFGIPFILFMSRHAKRNISFHLAMALWLVFMHFVDLYWLIMPNVSKTGVHITLVDVLSFLGIGGIYFGVFFNRLSKHSLVPINDPRIEESLSFHNV